MTTLRRRSWKILVAVVVTAAAGCSVFEKGVSLDDARRRATSPKARSYFTQMLGLENTGGVLSADKRTLWYPLVGADRGKRLVLQFGTDDGLDHAAVMSAGPGGKYDVLTKVLFDRKLWKPTTPLK